VDTEEMIEELRDSISEMMLETNLMFNDISKRFFPEFTSRSLGFFDTPLWIDFKSGRRQRHKRGRKGLKEKGPEGLQQQKFPEVPTKESQKGEEWKKDIKTPQFGQEGGKFKGGEENLPETSNLQGRENLQSRVEKS
jgi:hypothetical protein